MNAQSLIFLVVLAVECVMSQGPPTRTRKGRRPAANILTPVKYAIVPPPVAPKRAVLQSGPRRPVFQTYLPNSYVPQPSIPRSYPPAVAPQPSVLQSYLAATVARKPHQPAHMSYQPPAVAPATVPVTPSTYLTCEEQCPLYPAPVCGIYGTTYDNDCLRQCSAEPKDCNGVCPCPAPAPLPSLLGGCGYCNVFASYDPVCVEDDETLFNECEANCRGKRVLCSDACPC